MGSGLFQSVIAPQGLGHARTAADTTGGPCSPCSIDVAQVRAFVETVASRAPPDEVNYVQPRCGTEDTIWGNVHKACNAVPCWLCAT